MTDERDPAGGAEPGSSEAHGAGIPPVSPSVDSGAPQRPLSRKAARREARAERAGAASAGETASPEDRVGDSERDPDDGPRPFERVVSPAQPRTPQSGTARSGAAPSIPAPTSPVPSSPAPSSPTPSSAAPSAASPSGTPLSDAAQPGTTLSRTPESGTPHAGGPQSRTPESGTRQPTAPQANTSPSGTPEEPSPRPAPRPGPMEASPRSADTSSPGDRPRTPTPGAFTSPRPPVRHEPAAEQQEPEPTPARRTSGPAQPLDRTAALGALPSPESSTGGERKRERLERRDSSASSPGGSRRTPPPVPPEPARAAEDDAFSDPELLPDRPRPTQAEPESAYAPPAPVRRRRMSATTRFYLGFGIAVALFALLVGGIGYELGHVRGAAAARESQQRTLALEAQCLRDVKAVGATAGSGSTPAFSKAFEALAGANRCAQTNHLPSLSPADLGEVTGVHYDGALPPPPGDPRWSKPVAAPPKAGSATGIVVRGL